MVCKPNNGDTQKTGILQCGIKSHTTHDTDRCYIGEGHDNDECDCVANGEQNDDGDQELNEDRDQELNYEGREVHQGGCSARRGEGYGLKHIE